MKDAFGGSFILRIMLIFFVVFICFMTASITISKTFRIKNNVINILERSDPNQDDENKIKINDYLQRVSYNYKNNNNVRESCTNDGGSLTDNGVCVVKHENTNVSVYYKVTAYVVVDFPLFHLGTVIPISGETKVIYLDR